MLDTIFDHIARALSLLPPFTQENAPFYITLLLIYTVVFKVLTMILQLTLNKKLARVATPYASTDTREQKILILGDSTAVGAGADSPEDTIAGKLGRDFPQVQIVNYGINGGLIRDLAQEIKKARGVNYEMIIISAGGNDVWHLTRLTNIQEILDTVLEEARTLSNGSVIFLLYNNIADAPIFPYFVRGFLRWRGEKVQHAIRIAAARQRVPVIELFTQEEGNPFLKKPEELFAPDGAHPSSRGYALWYNRMWRQMAESGYSFNGTRS